jgi:hypothetical protein
LNLRENQLSWLPESIGFLFSLAKLDIEQNRESPHMATYLQILSAAAPRAAPADPAFVSTAPPAPQALVKHFREMLASHWSPSRSKVYVLGDGAISLCVRRVCVRCAVSNGALMFALLFGTDGVGKTSLIQSLRSESFKRESKLLGSKSGRNQRTGICIEDNTTTAAAKQADFSPLLDSLADASIQLQFWEFSGTRSRSPLSLVVLRSSLIFVAFLTLGDVDTHQVELERSTTFFGSTNAARSLSWCGTSGAPTPSPTWCVAPAVCAEMSVCF